MIKYVIGDLLSAEAQALVNTVNTVGVMGKGIALQFKEKYPSNFNHYLTACKNNQLVPGKLIITKESTTDSGEKIIINFPTKTVWYKKSQYSYIESGLDALVKAIKEYNIKSIAIPPLGCGNGGLNWDIVKSMMEGRLSELTDVDIQIFEPNEAVKEVLKNQEFKGDVKLTDARALILYTLFYYELCGGEYSSLFVANKIAFFFKRLREPCFAKLKFTKDFFGPYSVGVDHLIKSLNGKYLRGMEQMNAKPFETLELDYSKKDEISAYIKKQLKVEQVDRLKQLLKLIDGYQSALSLEVLATVDFIRSEYPNINEEETIKQMKEWSDRKRKLCLDKYISKAYRHLEEHSNRYFFNNK